MLENRSFDHYLGHLKGNGQDDVEVAAESVSNPDATGAPVPWHHATDLCLDDANHEWEPTHLEWDNGQIDGFVTQNDGAKDAEKNDLSGSRAMAYYDATDIPFAYQLASPFATADTYFCDLLGPTYPNRMYFYAASSHGFVENDLDQAPDRKTIFGALNDAQVSFKVYKSDFPAGVIEDGVFPDATKEDDGGTKVVDISQFAIDASNDELPAVAFIDPGLINGKATQSSEHPPADIQVGQKLIYDQVKALAVSPSWASSVMFITYDENGGFYDHVAPPTACPPDDEAPKMAPEVGGFDRYGFRVPLFAISPFAKKNYVSHVTHSHSSVLRFVAWRFDLPALTNRDANSDAMLDLFDFAHPPFAIAPELTEPPVDQAKLAACEAKYGL
jgi:phospholipase C